MAASADHRRLLGAFIRSHRERLAAPSAGEPSAREPSAHAASPHGAPPPRRRTKGLRREEVAQACGLSVTWYTWIEQGRDISISPASLARLADALRLTAAERAYVFELARKRDPAPAAAAPRREPAEVPRHLAAAIATIPGPAYLLDRLWHACAWNQAAAHLFAGWLGGDEPCLLRYVFLAPGARRLIVDWEDRARRLLAEFRADTALSPDDPHLRTLVDELRAASPVAARWWTEYAVLGREGGTRLFDHPADGRLRYHQVTLVPAGWPGHKFVMLLPDPDPTG